MRLRWLSITFCLGVAGMTWAGPSPLDEARSVLEEWVRTRQLISTTRGDWQADREMLEQTIQLYERELQSIEEQMSKLSTNNTQVVAEREQAEALLRSSNESLERSRQFAAGFEGKVVKLVPRLPEPLQEILKPQLARFPADPLNTKMPVTERVQALVGVLNELDKFNNAVNIFSEKRKNDQGEEIAVETVYVGLGAAYFVNDADDFAGTGVPGAANWEWTIMPGLGASVRDVVRIYRNEKGARFVALPASIR